MQQKFFMKATLKAAFLCLFPLLAFASTETLEEKSYRLHQAWALSRDYYFGTTLDVDRIKGLAWQLIYTQMLPTSYPGLKSLLKPYEQSLSDSQKLKAKIYAEKLRKKYHFGQRLDEKQLSIVFNREFSVDTKGLDTGSDVNDFKSFVNSISAKNKSIGLQIEKKAKAIIKKGGQIVFGRLIVNGSEMLGKVRCSANVIIYPDGSFIADGIEGSVLFELAGYLKIQKRLPVEKTRINLGKLVLNPMPKKSSSSLVGRFKTAINMDNVNVVLRLQSQNDEGPAWEKIYLPVTLLANGQFYAEHLSPGKYLLSVTANTKTKHQEINLSPGQVKNITLDT